MVAGAMPLVRTTRVDRIEKSGSAAILSPMMHLLPVPNDRRQLPLESGF
jgi:hypothetical protein